ncbi:cell division protein FtsL [Oharaeibacter diazotrophicus]|uniref:Cell division protein FtsL n=1 Tax=Oharaeibacter diazotrophicus TaxID=1920512 RepID=A0A4R6RGL6_9HYPH|nr:hypothetical protein [Oharaeibacter diazotrophicus]TDP85529.1 hypothetical protein EDD54_2383 [Oharaeibacter diazotrophicus]BBE74500.1 hypothetical protein OHA_1_04131 [Pleomorphomonas sp. SM30]GLS75801.1 hypothetical protein GCM10007904_11360 [Oharaeibacter diazotrophicus]
MKRTVNALLVALMVLSAAAVYDMKYEAELAAENVHKVERDIERERAALSLLKAEWSVLTQPGRLQDLAERHADILKLTPMTADHIVTLADIPAKPVEPAPDVSGTDDAVPHGPAQRSASAGRPGHDKIR